MNGSNPSLSLTINRTQTFSASSAGTGEVEAIFSDCQIKLNITATLVTPAG